MGMDLLREVTMGPPGPSAFEKVLSSVPQHSECRHTRQMTGSNGQQTCQGPDLEMLRMEYAMITYYGIEVIQTFLE